MDVNREFPFAHHFLQFRERCAARHAGFDRDEAVVKNIDHLLADRRRTVADGIQDAAPVRVAAIPGALDEGGVGHGLGRLARILEGRSATDLHLDELADPLAVLDDKAR